MYVLIGFIIQRHLTANKAKHRIQWVLRAFLTSNPLTLILSRIFLSNRILTHHIRRFIRIIRVRHQLRKLGIRPILRVKLRLLLLIIFIAHFDLDLDPWRPWLAVHRFIKHAKSGNFLRFDNSAILSLVSQFLISHFLQDLELIHVLLMKMLLWSVLILLFFKFLDFLFWQVENASDFHAVVLDVC